MSGSSGIFADQVVVFIKAGLFFFFEHLFLLKFVSFNSRRVVFQFLIVLLSAFIVFKLINIWIFIIKCVRL